MPLYNHFVSSFSDVSLFNHYSGALSKKDLAAIQNSLAKITHKWTDIGIQLEMDPDYLEKLRNQPNSSDSSNLRQMILTWLNGDDPVPTWSALCKALRAPAVEEEAIACCIEEEKIHMEGSAENTSMRLRIGKCGSQLKKNSWKGNTVEPPIKDPPRRDNLHSSGHLFYSNCSFL